MAEIKCPLSVDICTEEKNCAFYVDGKCAVVVIAEALRAVVPTTLTVSSGTGKIPARKE